MPNSQVDIIIPVYNQLGLTKVCIESIRQRSDRPYCLILIDNASDSETARFLESVKDEGNGRVLLVRNNENLGWVKAVNQGIKLSKAPYVCIMNNDTIVHTDKWLSGLINVAEEVKEIGLVNPKFDIKKKVFGASFIEIDFCRGYCVLIKREVIDAIGGLDEAYGLGYYDDDDFSVRAIRAGYRCVRANDVYVEHLRDSTFAAVFQDSKRRELHEKNKALFYSKWGKRLKVLVIITRDMDKDRASKELFDMARDQHIVYIWRSTFSALKLNHINIRELFFPVFFTWRVMEFAVWFNYEKRPGKRYDVIFADDEMLAGKLAKIRPGVYHANPVNNSDKIEQILKEASRV
jgi:GT2 family glycosyltransferase